jgi:acyl-CoA reductase-like NAD-dependent aldehyde dehydrogenase
VVVRDAGKTRENAMMGEIWPVAEKLRWTLRHGARWLAPERRSPGVFVHKRARVEFPPLGVIGVICPWNYPLQNVLGPTISALYAGNGVVCKVSEWVAWSAARFQRIFDEALSREGFSPDLVRLVNGYAQTGAALVSSGVDAVVFTGSMDNGRKIIAESARTITPVVLELGGKDPMIVCDDADLEHAAHTAMTGVFIAAGQNCLAAERVLVASAIHDAFVERVEPLVRALRQGPPLGPSPVDVGAIVSPLQLARIEALVSDAVAQGARAVVGGHRALDGTGHYFAPTLLVDVTPEMAIAQEEVFGPVMSVMRVQSDDDAIAVANGTPFGLGSTIVTRDLARARRIGEALVCGGVSVNDFALTYMAQALPFGGTRGSGFGRLNGPEGLRACTRPKAVLTDRVALSQPAKLYPVGPSDYAVARDVIQLVYQRGLSGKLGALGRLARTLTRRG